MDKINYQLEDTQEAIQLPEKLEFGKIFTDHLFEMDYNETDGWHNPTIKNYEKLVLDPATMVFHYGQAVFDGLKAYKTADGRIALFRPEKHIARMNNSSKIMCIPTVDETFILEALKELIRIDKDWIPEGKGKSLYIRPFIYGSDPFLGVKPSRTYKLIIILSPVGAYYAEGFKPVKILVQDEHVRAVRKGLGEAKTPANYAASLLAGHKASLKGFSQVLWLDAVELKYIDEVGAMNIFIAKKDEIVTPKLTGAILPGITRLTVIELLKSWGMKVTERLISIDEVIEEYDKGNIECVFGTGTAAVISSVGSLTFKDKVLNFNNGEANPLELKLFDEITSVQYGLKPDTHNWLTYI
ncbi:MAG: branched-chain amino acid aminotransferase [Ignavibacteriales bacterium]|nr:MAG: branched-chain amino acid aminotransferase [Ignavibacteriales bacterium]